MLFIWYPKCSTCQKAKKWLNSHEIEYTERLGIGLLSVVSRKNIFTHLQGGINDGNSKYV